MKELIFIYICFVTLTCDAQDSAQVFFRLGESELKSNKCTEAVKRFTNSIALYPTDSFYRLRGIAKLGLNDFSGCLLDVDSAIKLNPNNASNYFSRGNAHFALKDCKKAIEDVSVAIRLDSNFFEAYINRGIYKYSFRDYDGAIEDFTKASEIRPVPSAYWERAIAEAYKNDYKSALDDYLHCVKLDTANTDAYYKVGEMYHLLRDNTNAVKYYTQAIDLNPKKSYLYAARGCSEAALGLKKKGCHDIKIALKSGYKDARYLWAEFCK